MSQRCMVANQGSSWLLKFGERLVGGHLETKVPSGDPHVDEGAPVVASRGDERPWWRVCDGTQKAPTCW